MKGRSRDSDIFAISTTLDMLILPLQVGLGTCSGTGEFWVKGAVSQRKACSDLRLSFGKGLAGADMYNYRFIFGKTPRRCVLKEGRKRRRRETFILALTTSMPV